MTSEQAVEQANRAGPTLWRLSFWFGVATLALGAVLLVVMPSEGHRLAPGFHTPIIAFEFARSAADIEGVFGPGLADQRAPLLDAMDLGNRIDFLFLLAYGDFLLLVCLAVASESAGALRVAARIGALCSVVAEVCDALENVQLLAITASLREGTDYGEPLARLGVFTWGKWGGLLIAFSCLVPWLWRAGRWGRVVALGTFVAVASALGSGPLRGSAHELLATAVFIMFVALWLLVWARQRAPRAAHNLPAGNAR